MDMLQKNRMGHCNVSSLTNQRATVSCILMIRLDIVLSITNNEIASVTKVAMTKPAVKLMA
jgi:hypothetical protein